MNLTRQTVGRRSADGTRACGAVVFIRSTIALARQRVLCLEGRRQQRGRYVNPDRTSEYMPLELSQIQVALRRAVRHSLSNRDTDWTMAILRALADMATGKCVDPDVRAPRRGRGRIRGEYLWDLCISDWPTYKGQPYVYPDYFAAVTTPRLLLVAECEWGKEGSARENGQRVLEDFSKILHARAPIKVMVFSYFACDHDHTWSPTTVTSSFQELTGHMARLIAASNDEAEYVLFGVAWNEPAQYSEATATRTGCSRILVNAEV